jgi:hypothetical protein
MRDPDLDMRRPTHEQLALLEIRIRELEAIKARRK